LGIWDGSSPGCRRPGDQQQRRDRQDREPQGDEVEAEVIDVQTLMRPVTKWSAKLSNPAQMPWIMRRAF
jgi:thiamine pyrophosphate-dependent acetolactate synthase large subunit-like protein